VPAITAMMLAAALASVAFAAGRALVVIFLAVTVGLGAWLVGRRMMDAEVEQVCGAGHGKVGPGRVNSRNGYRRREWDTRAGTVELAIPGLRQGTYYPEWLLERCSCSDVSRDRRGTPGERWM
jgi:hypothetical protein